MEVSTMFISINAAIGILGVFANLLLITLIMTKTPVTIKTYTRLVLCAAICDLTGITMFLICMPRLHNIPRGMVLIFYGFCNYIHEKICWASFGITEQLIIVNDALICLSFIYRLHATTKLPPATYKIFIAVAVVVGFTLTTSIGYYRLLNQGRDYAISTTDEEFKNFTDVSFINGFLDFTFDETPVVLSWTNFSAEIFFGSAILLRFLTARRFKALQALNAQLLILFCFVVASTNVAIDLYRIVESDIPGFIVLPSACLQFLLSPVANLVIITPYRRHVAVKYSNKMQTTFRFLLHVLRGGSFTGLGPSVNLSSFVSSSVRPLESMHGTALTN